MEIGYWGGGGNLRHFGSYFRGFILTMVWEIKSHNLKEKCIQTTKIRDI